VESLRAWADAGDVNAALQLGMLQAGHAADLLAGLRARADAGDQSAPVELAGLLSELAAGRGDLEGAVESLRAWAVAGDQNAAWQLAEVLTKQGQDEEAEQLRRFGLNPDGSTACA
jgi:uncharacterized protein HemY